MFSSAVTAKDGLRGQVAFCSGIIKAGLKIGCIVQLPNGTHFKLIGEKNGSVEISMHISPDVDKKVNTGFRSKWINAENKGKS